MEELPILSLSRLNSSYNNSEIRKLYEVCIAHGFFYLEEHGIEKECIQKTLDASRNFFNLSDATKRQYSHEYQLVYPKSARGYVPEYGETLHADTGPDRKEVFDLGIERPLNREPFVGPTVMPNDNVAPGFSTTHLNLQYKIMGRVVPILLHAFALALNLPIDTFIRFFTKPILIQRAIHYPAYGSGAGKHTDNGIFTVLIQEQHTQPSLRAYTKNKWIDIPCLEDTFIINLGDMLQLWTNGHFTSTPHEVLHGLSVSRLSVAFFLYPDIDSIIKPFGTNQEINARDVMLENFNSIWIAGKGAGRAKELA